MLLTIHTPEQKLRSAPIEKVTVPTQIGEITILSGHQPLISVIKSGLIKVVPQEMPAPDSGYVIVDGYVMIAVSQGLLTVTDQEIIVTTSVGMSTPKETLEVLEKMHADMLLQLAKIKQEGNQEDLEDALLHMEKITADLRITKIGHIH